VAAGPRYNEVWGTATHNSYWMNRTDQNDYEASGAQELLTDQLLHEHIRGIEIDIHTDGAPDGEWRVYHTSGSEDFTCSLLGDCLEYLRAFQYAVPDHEVLNVVLELKNTSNNLCGDTNPNFDDGTHRHRIEDLDSVLRAHLGDSLYTPADFLRRCPAADRGSLRRCMDGHGWPGIETLRGRIIVNLIGNYYGAGKDWAEYSGRAIAERVAFPMQSVLALRRLPTIDTVPDASDPLRRPCAAAAFSVDLGYVDPGMGDRFACIGSISTYCTSVSPLSGFPTTPPSVGLRRAAFANSVFWQFEPVKDPLALQVADLFIRHGGVVRGADSWEWNDTDTTRETTCTGGDDPHDGTQSDRLAHGFQFLQTDYPWHVIYDGGPPGTLLPTDPSRRLKRFSARPGSGATNGPPPAGAPIEPGSKIYLHLAAKSGSVAAARPVAGASGAWLETTVSTTRRGTTWSAVKAFPATPGECPLTFRRRAAEDTAAGLFVSSGEETLRIARTKHSSCDYKDNWPMLQEGVVVSARYSGPARHPTVVRTGGRFGPCRREATDTGSHDNCAEVGGLLAIRVSKGGREVSAYSTSTIASGGKPRWVRVTSLRLRRPATVIGLEAAVAPPEAAGGPDEAAAACKAHRGFPAYAGADALFAGTRFSGKLDDDSQPVDLHPITLRELPIHRTDPGDLPADRAAIVDLSGSLACGGAGQACCGVDAACNASTLRCLGGKCQACGAVGQMCCAEGTTACFEGGCEAGTCACGNEGELCCGGASGNACGSGLGCRMTASGRRCERACGHQREACCPPDGTCGPALVCDRGVCACGGRSQPCCLGQVCGGGDRCAQGRCQSPTSACALCEAKRADTRLYCDCIQQNGCPPNFGLCGPGPRSP
jgi:hypothetical protein